MFVLNKVIQRTWLLIWLQPYFLFNFSINYVKTNMNTNFQRALFYANRRSVSASQFISTTTRECLTETHRWGGRRWLNLWKHLGSVFHMSLYRSKCWNPEKDCPVMSDFQTNCWLEKLDLMMWHNFTLSDCQLNHIYPHTGSFKFFRPMYYCCLYYELASLTIIAATSSTTRRIMHINCWMVQHFSNVRSDLVHTD